MKNNVNRPGKYIGMLLILAIIFSLALSFSGCGQTVDLGDYITIDVEGYNGAGTATCHIDYDGFGQKYKIKEKLQKGLKKELQKDYDDDKALAAGFLSLFDEGDAAEYLFDDVLDLHTSFENKDGLSNGNDVVLNLSISESGIKEVKDMVGIQVKCPSQISRKIAEDELPLTTQIDVSAYIETVKFKGREGAAEVKIGLKDTQTNVDGFVVKVSNDDNTLKVSKGDDLLKTCYIDLVSINGSSDSDTLSYYGWGSDKKYKVANGDKVEIGVKDDLNGTEGFVLTNKTKAFTVKGISEFIKDPDEVPVKAIINDVKRRYEDFSWLKNRKYTVTFLKRTESSAEYANRVIVRMDATNTFLTDPYKDTRVLIYNNVFLNNGELDYVGDAEDHQYDEAGGNYQNLAADYKEFINDDSYTATKLQ